MADQQRRELFEGLSFRAHLPVAWTSGPLPDAGEQARIRDNNLTLLRALNALEERPAESGEEGHSAEMRRLESRLDLALVLLGRLLREREAVPDPRELRMSAAGIAWTPGEPVPAVGATGVIEVYLTTHAPQPLSLPATIQASGDEAGNPGEFPREAVFEDPGDSVRDALEKLIFRYHRREVADHRRSS